MFWSRTGFGGLENRLSKAIVLVVPVCREEEEEEEGGGRQDAAASRRAQGSGGGAHSCAHTNIHTHTLTQGSGSAASTGLDYARCSPRAAADEISRTYLLNWGEHKHKIHRRALFLTAARGEAALRLTEKKEMGAKGSL